MCKYGRKNEYLLVYIFMYIHLIVILSILNDIESHNAGGVSKQKNVESLRYWVGTDSVSPASNRSSCIPSGMLS